MHEMTITVYVPDGDLEYSGFNEADESNSALLGSFAPLQLRFSSIQIDGFISNKGYSLKKLSADEAAWVNERVFGDD